MGEKIVYFPVSLMGDTFHIPLVDGDNPFENPPSKPSLRRKPDGKKRDRVLNIKKKDQARKARKRNR